MVVDPSDRCSAVVPSALWVKSPCRPSPNFTCPGWLLASNRLNVVPSAVVCDTVVASGPVPRVTTVDPSDRCSAVLPSALWVKSPCRPSPNFTCPGWLLASNFFYDDPAAIVCYTLAVPGALPSLMVVDPSDRCSAVVPS